MTTTRTTTWIGSSSTGTPRRSGPAGAAVEEFVEPGATAGSSSATRHRPRGAIDGGLDRHDTMTGPIGRGTLTGPGARHVYGSLMTDVERLPADPDRADAR
ncbi:hypothetical protein [Streptomyces fagopyri]|uniref:hypothetical protein n=1 Tax=Streptomyces fagopyri TaxID=2662397 RepID=UPI003724957D